MDIGMEAGIFLAYTAGMFIIYFFGQMLLVPLKKILKLLISSIIGGAVLILINIFGTGIGIVIPLNLITAMIAGVLGVPGIAALLIYFNAIM